MNFVRHSTSASVAVASLALLALFSLFLVTSHAQVNGTPTSASSHGFGGSHPVTAPFPAGGTLPGHSVPHSTSALHTGAGDGEHHHHHYVQYRPPLIYAVPYPVPYAIDIGDVENDSAADNENENDNANDSDANYQGGPTIFDRRGNGANSYIPPRADATSPEFLARADANPPEPAPVPTTLVFKDGHIIEVGNYAIVGATLFDLTPGHSRKVALADLDLQSTQRQNDTHGITFQLPPPTQAN
jgi:hypothetical protein